MPRLRQFRTARRGHPIHPAAGTVCKYPHHFCQKECLEGYSLCSLHILEDRAAPYRPCTFMYSNGKKCGVPVSRKDSQQQCAEHRHRLAVAREKAERPRRPAESLDSLTEQLQRRLAAAQAAPAAAASGSGSGSTSAGDGWEVAQRALQYRSDSEAEDDDEEEGERMVESPLEPPLSSDDCLSGLSDEDDDSVLRHAGVYTDEEVVRLAERRLKRLQQLYLGQFERLEHVLKSKRRAYLLEVAREKETMKSISGAPRETAAEQQAYDLLRAHGHYHKPAGKDYLFWQQRHEKRAAEAGGATRAPTVTRCTHAEGRVRCTQRTIPLSKYCLKHIIHDQHQVLFRPCGGGSPTEPCQTPVVAVQRHSRCRLHTPLPEATAVRLPQPPPDPVEVMLGLSDGEDLPLDETQSRLVASIANTLMASAGGLERPAGGATELPQGVAGVAASASSPSVNTAASDRPDESGGQSEPASEVAVTGGTELASSSEGAAGGTRPGSPTAVDIMQ